MRADPTPHRAAALLCLALAPAAAIAQSGAGAVEMSTRLAPVVVTVTRTEAPAFDIPASIDRIGGDEVRDERVGLQTQPLPSVHGEC